MYIHIYTAPAAPLVDAAAETSEENTPEGAANNKVILLI